MAGYNQRVERSETGTDARELPERVAREVIQDVTNGSAMLQMASVRRMGTRQERLTLLDTFPDAYWQSGEVDYPPTGGDNDSGSARAKDSQPKQTTKVTWRSATLVAEELAVQVPIPDAYVDDSGAPLFSEIRPLLAEAFARKIDSAMLFDVDNPFTNAGSQGIIPAAIAAGNVTTQGDAALEDPNATDLAADLALMARRASAAGNSVNGFVTEPAFGWRLIGMRSVDGIPIYAPPAGAQPATLFGRAMAEVRSGVWDSDEALVLTGDFSKAIVGIRQDMTFSLSDSGVIYDPATGLVRYSAFQQDGKILRAVMRVAFTVVQPVMHLGSLYPFNVLAAAAPVT